MSRQTSDRRRGVFGMCLVLALAVVQTPRTHAEIEKVARPGDRDIDLMWWPKVTPPADWVHDSDVSYENHINLFVRKGENFDDAPAILYARALYYDQGDTVKELEDAIRDDQQGFLERYPDSKIAEVEAVKTGDGTRLRTFTFTPVSKGNWELVAYGREPKYVLFFCISAKTKQALEQNRDAFLAMVRSYTSRDEP